MEAEDVEGREGWGRKKRTGKETKDGEGRKEQGRKQRIEKEANHVEGSRGLWGLNGRKDEGESVQRASQTQDAGDSSSVVE
ncbi:hypothetical protein Pcinc_042735 [Petrolisthes cinctipes]|uniref:Uncharacterized protein n=1 Tax=Petrolisthes cinctipes TaxID=88211 RepID=A0AAE1BHC8_PETCI|nr:hypothetical protein Pcinc_042735 [Petrolisthes cinctipes]